MPLFSFFHQVLRWAELHDRRLLHREAKIHNLQVNIF